MLTGVAMLADFRHDLLQNDELIRNKRECRHKLVASGEALNVQHRITKGKQVLQDGVFFLINGAQQLLSLVVLCKHTLLDNLIN